jgi:hypothetical protein
MAMSQTPVRKVQSAMIYAGKLPLVPSTGRREIPSPGRRAGCHVLLSDHTRPE